MGILSPPAPVAFPAPTTVVIPGTLYIEQPILPLLPPPPVRVTGRAITLPQGIQTPIIGQTPILMPVEPTIKPAVKAGGPMKTVVPIPVTFIPGLVVPPGGGTAKAGLVVKGDDTYANIRTDRLGAPMIRLACLKDESAVFHALAKCLMPKYAETKDYNTRVNIVHQLRAEIGYFITLNAAHYTAAGYGKWAQRARYTEVAGQLVLQPGLPPQIEFDEYGNRVDYSFQGLRLMFNSKRSISQEFFDDIANTLGIKMIMVDVVGNLVRDEIRFKVEHPEIVAKNMTSNRTIILFEPEKGVVEIVGIKTPKGLLQIVFADSDALITAIKSKS